MGTLRNSHRADFRILDRPEPPVASHAAGSIIVGKGEPALAMFLVRKGRVAIRLKDKPWRKWGRAKSLARWRLSTMVRAAPGPWRSRIPRSFQSTNALSLPGSGGTSFRTRRYARPYRRPPPDEPAALAAKQSELMLQCMSPAMALPGRFTSLTWATGVLPTSAASDDAFNRRL